MKKILFLIIMLLGMNLQAQQAWTQKKGEGYFQIGSSSLSYSALHIGRLKSRDIPRPITELVLSIYGEYGLSDKLTAIVTLPYHIITSDDLVSGWNGFAPEKGELSALGNVNIAGTYQLYQKKDIVISSKLGVGLNSASSELSSGLRTGFDAFSVSPSILAGIGKSNYFASAETGMNFLSNNYLPRFILNAQIGKYLLPSKRLLFIFGFTSSTALGNISEEDISKLDGNAVFTGLYLNKQSYYAGNLKFGYQLNNNWTTWLSAAGGAAENVGQNVLYSFALSYNLKK